MQQEGAEAHGSGMPQTGSFKREVDHGVKKHFPNEESQQTFGRCIS